MRDRTSGSHHEPVSMLTYGLLLGPALGMLLALVLGRGDDLASGLVWGAGLGVVIGATLDSIRRHRH